ncbi:MAG: GntR family transcriptional regulator [Phycisphaerales bacterium]|nr:GntR family transcriptional regulator [Phycisphaerales bacterium]MCB9856667.1 GntR family transcriptional regulator [Phycisphaerales bacterium]MCB9862206.1 GntR family transcriptional regulator [Phycisphaerales bacterium]
MIPQSNPDIQTTEPSPRLSYKFQRLRERIRRSILAGEFGERLPGERALARRYHANAKTVNKALCDLATEGLLVRHIGRGTFVANSASEEGETAPGLRSRQFACISDTGCDAHERFDRELSAGVTENGDRLVFHGRSTRRGTASLNDWPADARSDTHGLFVTMPRALSDRNDLDEELILHACRRQTPVVAVGACAASAKLNAVAPDFVDGGFRLAEHLLRVGCDVVRTVTTQQNRETAAVLNGARTAAARFGGQIAQFDLTKSTAISNGNGNGNTEDQTVGLMLIGSDAIRAFLADKHARHAWEQGIIAVACFPDVGDESTAGDKLTAYECDAGTIARWACRLMNDTRPGRRPVEFLIPGMLHVRETICTTTPAQLERETAKSSRRLPEIAI